MPPLLDSLPFLFSYLLLFKISNLFAQLVIGLTSTNSQCGPNQISLFNGVGCTTDQNCQELAPGFFCFQGHCCAAKNPSPSGYGSACTQNSQCKFTNSECRKDLCYCRIGFNYNGEDCLPQGVYDPRPNAGCAMGQVSINGHCYDYVAYGGFCEYSKQCNYLGSICFQKRCVCPPGQLYNGKQCINDPNIPNVLCPPNHIMLNGQCLPLVGVGERCMYDLQCRTRPGDHPLICRNFACYFIGTNVGAGYPFVWEPRGAQLSFPKCRNPSADVEVSGGIPIDCVYKKCSPGYHCEYNNLYKGGQYICCGISPENPIYGQAKMYPGYTNLPLQCTAINSCTFVDFPYCVWSESYRHKVCCSRPQCI
uniref:EB domain-containing protein n=1 Tax=Meloidogyne incognita TaxID=6306 RepID=A0A914LEE0_MELIC